MTDYTYTDALVDADTQTAEQSYLIIDRGSPSYAYRVATMSRQTHTAFVYCVVLFMNGIARVDARRRNRPNENDNSPSPAPGPPSPPVSKKDQDKWMLIGCVAGGLDGGSFYSSEFLKSSVRCAELRKRRWETQRQEQCRREEWSFKRNRLLINKCDVTFFHEMRKCTSSIVLPVYD